MMIWTVMSFVSFFMAYICWYAKGKGSIAIFISSIIIGILLAQAFILSPSQGFYIQPYGSDHMDTRYNYLIQKAKRICCCFRIINCNCFFASISYIIFWVKINHQLPVCSTSNPPEQIDYLHLKALVSLYNFTPGSCAIIMTTAESNGGYSVSGPLLEKQNIDWCVFKQLKYHIKGKVNLGVNKR